MNWCLMALMRSTRSSDLPYVSLGLRLSSTKLGICRQVDRSSCYCAPFLLQILRNRPLCFHHLRLLILATRWFCSETCWLWVAFRPYVWQGSFAMVLIGVAHLSYLPLPQFLDLNWLQNLTPSAQSYCVCLGYLTLCSAFRWQTYF